MLGSSPLLNGSSSGCRQGGGRWRARPSLCRQGEITSEIFDDLSRLCALPKAALFDEIEGGHEVNELVLSIERHGSVGIQVSDPKPRHAIRGFESRADDDVGQLHSRTRL